MSCALVAGAIVVSTYFLGLGPNVFEMTKKFGQMTEMS